MATHDGGDYLEPLLASLLAQTRPPDELVVCDDASADGTPERLDAFALTAPFPVAVHRCAWRGHTETFIDAARRCTGDAIAFCDADDVWRADKLALCEEALERSGAILALHTTEVVDEELRPLGRRWPTIERTEVAETLGLTALDVLAPGMSMVVRRSVVEVADWEARPHSRYGSDHQMFHDEWVLFLAGVLGPIQLLAEPLLQYRQHGSNVSGGWVDRRRERTLRPALDDYRRAHSYTAACADYLDRTAAGDVPADVAERLRAGADAYRRDARNWELRATLYESRQRTRRARAVRRLIAQRAYRDRRSGGFGREALGKDVAAVALRTRPLR
jgi:glycosyltransferase involved in cell wall biosynthesis